MDLLIDCDSWLSFVVINYYISKEHLDFLIHDMYHMFRKLSTWASLEINALSHPILWFLLPLPYLLTEPPYCEPPQENLPDFELSMWICPLKGIMTDM